MDYLPGIGIGPGMVPVWECGGGVILETIRNSHRTPARVLSIRFFKWAFRTLSKG